MTARSRLTALLEQSGRPGGRDRGGAILVITVVACLLPFIDKAFTIDDPLFLWLGRHIQSQPLDFYAFTVNWYGTEMPMYEVTRNPPATGYFLAAVGAVVGWSEVGLHLAFLLPAAGAALATFLLARRLCENPIEAALIGLLTPVFMLSSTNLMCDTMMLALWCASIWCWIEGLDRERFTWLIAGALLAGLAALTKYFGLALLPLLALYGLMRRRAIGGWILPLLLPLGLVVAYELVTRSLYDRGLVLDAASYATTFAGDAGPSFVQKTIIGLVFAGGCLVPALFYAPLLWSRRTLWLGGAVIASCLVSPPLSLGLLGVQVEDESRWLVIQLALLGLGGVSLAGLALGDLWQRRDPDSWLLGLWLIGTLTFAVYLNWVNNGRSNLPMAPALGILVLRRLEHLAASGHHFPTARRLAAFVPSLLVAFAVTYADYSWANEVRDSASAIADRWVSPDRTTYFEGHWGFQYYMELFGATALQFNVDTVDVGDLQATKPFRIRDERLPGQQSGVFH